MTIRKQPSEERDTLSDEFEILDAKIAAKKSLIETCRRIQAREKAQHQNELAKLRSARNDAEASLATQFAVLTLKKKNAAGKFAVLDMALYREAVTTVFAETYLPTFCIAKQASLLRAVHYMMCSDQALTQYQQQCAADFRLHNLMVIQQQDALAVASKELLNSLMALDLEIAVHRTEMGARGQKQWSPESTSTRKLSHDVKGGELLHKLPLINDSLTKNIVKRSDQSVDTASLDYDSSDDSTDFFTLDSGSHHSLPRVVHG